jgi:hypothetical protein
MKRTVIAITSVLAIGGLAKLTTVDWAGSAQPREVAASPLQPGDVSESAAPQTEMLKPLSNDFSPANAYFASSGFNSIGGGSDADVLADPPGVGYCNVYGGVYEMKYSYSLRRYVYVSTSNPACCRESCGMCVQDRFCSRRSGGTSNCCPASIRAANKTCGHNGRQAPCEF